MNSKFKYKILPVVLILVYVFYNLPFIRSLCTNGLHFSDLFLGSDNMMNPLSRSIVFAIVQALVYCVFALFFSTILYPLKIEQKLSRILTILIFPFLIGNVSTAFIFKLLLVENPVSFTSSYKFVLLSLICLWQYGTLFIYLFWMNQQTISTNTSEFARVSRLSIYERFRDIILPKQLNLILLTFIIGFVFSLYEDFKLKLLFKASRGTKTELINSWINRSYNSDSLSNIEMAFEKLTLSSFATFFISILILGIFIKVLLAFVKKAQKIPNFILNAYSLSKHITRVGIIFLICFVSFPILIAATNIFDLRMVNITQLIQPIILTSLVAIFASIIAISLGICLRLGWSIHFEKLNKTTISILILNFSALLIPPFLLLILGFQWMKTIEYKSLFNVFFAWSIGQILFVFPVLVAFVIVTHFKVKQNDIEYLQIHQVSFPNIVKNLFWLPCKGDYLLLTILAFSTIWNEANINSILSDIIPSFVTELNKTIIGRSADYSSGITYLLFSFFIGFLCIAIWDRLLFSYQKNLRDLK